MDRNNSTKDKNDDKDKNIKEDSTKILVSTNHSIEDDKEDSIVPTENGQDILSIEEKLDYEEISKN